MKAIQYHDPQPQNLSRCEAPWRFWGWIMILKSATKTQGFCVGTQEATLPVPSRIPRVLLLLGFLLRKKGQGGCVGDGWGGVDVNERSDININTHSPITYTPSLPCKWSPICPKAPLLRQIVGSRSCFWVCAYMCTCMCTCMHEGQI